MFGFAIWIFTSLIMFFGCNLPSVNSLKCISMNNRKCKLRPQIVNVISKEHVFFKVKLAKITSAENENKHKCSSWTLYIVLFL